MRDSLQKFVIGAEQGDPRSLLDLGLLKVGSVSRLLDCQTDHPPLEAAATELGEAIILIKHAVSQLLQMAAPSKPERPPIGKALAAQVQLLIDRQHWKKPALAEAVGVSRSAMYALLNGTARASNVVYSKAVIAKLEVVLEQPKGSLQAYLDDECNKAINSKEE